MLVFTIVTTLVSVDSLKLMIQERYYDFSPQFYHFVMQLPTYPSMSSHRVEEVTLFTLVLMLSCMVNGIILDFTTIRD